MQSKCLEDLIIEAIRKCNNFYNYFCDKWENYWSSNNFGLHFNQKRKLVKEARDDEIYSEIKLYYEFLNNNLKEFTIDGGGVFDYESRIKGSISLDSKIDKYTFCKNEKGEIPINKCLNDLFGMRFTIFDKNTYNNIENVIIKEFPYLKIEHREIKSENYTYRAKHIYFKKDNFNFQWELQLWFQGFESENKKAHNEKDEFYTNVPRVLKENL